MVQLIPAASSPKGAVKNLSSRNRNGSQTLPTSSSSSLTQHKEKNMSLDENCSTHSLSSSNTNTTPISTRVAATSINKTLTTLRSLAENRSCADCRAALVDPGTTFASFCMSDDFIVGNQHDENEDTTNHHETSSVVSSPTFKRMVGISLHDFALNHQAFAPPEAKSIPTSIGENDKNQTNMIEKHEQKSSQSQREDKKVDFGELANQRFGGHGVFLCSGCAEAHRALGSDIAQVLPVTDLSCWTIDSVEWMKQSGGNARCWRVYEAYVTDTWKQRRPISSSSLSERLLFCRAKYEALAFCLPPPGPLAESAWESVLFHNTLGQQFAKSSDLRNIINLSASKTIAGQDGAKSAKPTVSKNSLPNRLVDHFCVVSSSMQILPSQIRQGLSGLTSVEELRFWPHISDCYPERGVHSDMEFPEHLSSFVMPRGCHPVSQPLPPSFFSFVLTMGDGERLYGCSLQIYDEHYDLDDLREAIDQSEYTGKLPNFLDDLDSDVDDTTTDKSDVVFLPKSLVFLSHHPFFDLFRSVLLELYEISLMAAPLPIERYIANFAREVPLPPKGRVKVEFSFTTGRTFSIERPAINKLPMANFSYRPLFASLSVSNIIVVLASLMEERKVVVLSRHQSILTPVTEALLSALFPFQWVGLYIPVVPLSMMLDIVEAPVPYLLGMDSLYFEKVCLSRRPEDALLVDLDRDVVHMGSLQIPKVPARDAEKLLVALENTGGTAYLIPNSGIKGCIMAGTEKSMLVENESRPRYAHMLTMKGLDAESLCRSDVFSVTEMAYGGKGGNPEAISGFGTTHGHLTSTAEDAPVEGKKGGKILGMKPMKQPKFMRNKKATVLSNSDASRSHGHLLDITEEDARAVTAIRSAFLRFTVTLFAEYEDSMGSDSSRRFLNDKKVVMDIVYESGQEEFLHNVVRTQMFQHFLQERKENPENPEIRFFDESRIAKLNRSKKATMANGGKKRPTPFLNDMSWKVTKTYTPPPPSNLGLPDRDEAYVYGTFPQLDPSRYGRIRPPTIWRQNQSTRFKSSQKSSKVTKTERDIVGMALRPIMTAHGAVMAAAARTARDLDSALVAVSAVTGSRGKKDDLTSAEQWKQSVTQKRTVTLSKADMIMVNARRKNVILLDCIVKIQAIGRGYLSRIQFDKIRRCESSRLKLAMARKEIDLVKSITRQNAKERQSQNEKAIVIQSLIRTHLCRAWKMRALQAIVSIQKIRRTVEAQCRWIRIKAATLLLQKRMRGRRTRMFFLEVRNLVVLVQARVRGLQVRMKVHFVLKEKMSMYRRQIFNLWTIVHLPLAVRTKMWVDLRKTSSFLCLRLAESELCRLWSISGCNDSVVGKSGYDQAAKLSEHLGLNNTVYLRCKGCEDGINTRMSSISTSSHMDEALKAEEVERLQIYERLTAIASDQVLANLYREFGIPSNDKMKKVSLARTIWTSFHHVDHSVTAMMLLFPELSHSIAITFRTPSTKGQRRFSNAGKHPLPLLDQKLWNQISAEGNVKKHVQEVGLLYINKLPSVSKKLDRITIQRNPAFPLFYKRAIKEVYGTPSWKEARHILILKYLDGRYACKSNPNVDDTIRDSSKKIPPSTNPFEGCDLIDEKKVDDTSIHR